MQNLFIIKILFARKLKDTLLLNLIERETAVLLLITPEPNINIINTRFIMEVAREFL